MVNKVVIVGAGPSGVLLAHYLLRRGDKYQVDIYERRNDPRIISFSNSRTYPITLSERGMTALRKIEGIEAAVQEISLEITGAISHGNNGKARLLPRRKPLLALDRTNLAIALLETLAQKYDNNRLNIYFNHKCTGVDLAAKTVTFQNVSEAMPTSESNNLIVDYDLLIGADGARSIVREHFLNTELFEFEQKYVPSDYKSIYLSKEDLNGDLTPGYIHTWRLDDATTLLMLHDVNGNMSGVIHFPREHNQVVNLSTTADVQKFFQDNFLELGQLIPDSEAEAFLKRPVSSILTSRCNRYHYDGSVLLIGDAAHAVSPSIGQGCNSALEDVQVFDSLLDEYDDNLAVALEQFTARRLADVHALAEMSDYAFPSSKKLFIEFMLREAVARNLHKLFPKRFLPSMFQLLSETTTPYSQILKLHKGWISKVKKSQEVALNPK
ncbi:MAG TPA: NAD(P)/FAD-dependent oxidoreductase [Oculatellaceae cyanobacterium]